MYYVLFNGEMFEEKYEDDDVDKRRIGREILDYSS